jgi:hypothetical protein
LLIQGAVFTFREIDKSILKARSYSHQNGNFGFFHLLKARSPGRFENDAIYVISFSYHNVIRWRLCEILVRDLS